MSARFARKTSKIAKAGSRRTTSARQLRWFRGKRLGVGMFVLAFAIVGTVTVLVSMANSAAGPIKGIGGKCLDNRGSHLKNKNKVQLFGCNGTAAQLWTVQADGTIRLTDKYCLDAKYGGTAARTPVWLWQCNGTAAQQWRVGPGGSIVSASAGLCLDDQWSRARDGNPVWLYVCNGTAAQKWTMPKAAHIVIDSTAGADATVPSTSAATASTSGSPSGGTYAKPGTVGYQGNIGDLKFGTPAGCIATVAGVACNGTNVTLDHVYVKGGLAWAGSGKLTITNSVIEGGGTAANPYAVYASNATGNPMVYVADSTLRWPSGKAFPQRSSNGLIVSDHAAYQLYRNDISGQPHGIDIVGPGSVLDGNWVHGLLYAASDPHPSGVFVTHGGTNVALVRNYIDATMDGQRTTAALLVQNLATGKADISGLVVKSNYLAGGAFSFLDKSTDNADIEGNTMPAGAQGPASLWTPATIKTWSANTTTQGTPIPKPTAHKD